LRLAARPGLDHLPEQRSQIQPETLSRHRQELPRRSSGGRLQIFSGAGRVVDHVTVVIDDDMRRGKVLHDVLFDSLPQGETGEGLAPRKQVRAGAGTHAMQRDWKPPRGGGIGASAKVTMPLFDRRKQIRELAGILGRAEEQIAVRTQRIVACRDQLILRVGAEVNQQVLAGHRIDARERRVADDAVG